MELTEKEQNLIVSALLFTSTPDIMMQYSNEDYYQMAVLGKKLAKEHNIAQAEAIHFYLPKERMLELSEDTRIFHEISGLVEFDD